MFYTNSEYVYSYRPNTFMHILTNNPSMEFFFLEIRNRHLQLDAIKYLIQLLPVVNRNTLHALLMFLSNLSKCSEDSKNINGKK